MSSSSQYRTSISHPLSISWILPCELLKDDKDPAPALTTSDKDLLDTLIGLGPRACSPAAALAESTPIPPLESSEGGLARGTTAAVSTQPQQRKSAARPGKGNFALSSCPGKQVRLDGPVNGRASVKRDLSLDFARLASLNVKVVICCIDDNELQYLGAPSNEYEGAAARNGIEVMRLPMVEGSHPNHPSDLDPIFEKMQSIMEAGGNVLIHCRGGLGRAGVVACCFLLRQNLLRSKKADGAKDGAKATTTHSSVAEKQRQGKSGNSSIWGNLRYDADRAMARLFLDGHAADDEATNDGDACGRSRLAAAAHVSAGFLDNLQDSHGNILSGPTTSDEVEACRRAIQYVRLRRSSKAIETRRQEEFISSYARWINDIRSGTPKA